MPLQSTSYRPSGINKFFSAILLSLIGTVIAPWRAFYNGLKSPFTENETSDVRIVKGIVISPLAAILQFIPRTAHGIATRWFKWGKAGAKKGLRGGFLELTEEVFHVEGRAELRLLKARSVLDKFNLELEAFMAKSNFKDQSLATVWNYIHKCDEHLKSLETVNEDLYNLNATNYDSYFDTQYLERIHRDEPIYGIEDKIDKIAESITDQKKALQAYLPHFILTSVIEFLKKELEQPLAMINIQGGLSKIKTAKSILQRHTDFDSQKTKEIHWVMAQFYQVINWHDYAIEEFKKILPVEEATVQSIPSVTESKSTVSSKEENSDDENEANSAGSRSSTVERVSDSENSPFASEQEKIQKHIQYSKAIKLLNSPKASLSNKNLLETAENLFHIEATLIECQDKKYNFPLILTKNIEKILKEIIVRQKKIREEKKIDKRYSQVILLLQQIKTKNLKLKPEQVSQNEEKNFVQKLEQIKSLLKSLKKDCDELKITDLSEKIDISLKEVNFNLKGPKKFDHIIQKYEEIKASLKNLKTLSQVSMKIMLKNVQETLPGLLKEIKELQTFISAMPSAKTDKILNQKLDLESMKVDILLLDKIIIHNLHVIECQGIKVQEISELMQNSSLDLQNEILGRPSFDFGEILLIPVLDSVEDNQDSASSSASSKSEDQTRTCFSYDFWVAPSVTSSSAMLPPPTPIKASAPVSRIGSGWAASSLMASSSGFFHQFPKPKERSCFERFADWIMGRKDLILDPLPENEPSIHISNDNQVDESMIQESTVSTNSMG